MNKKFFMSLLTIMMVAFMGVLFVSCGNDETEEVIHTLDKSSIILYVDETSTLKYSGEKCYWSSDNHYIAEVEDGVVTAKHVGTTMIHANDLTCIVTVKPRYTSYTEPYMNWGASKSDVKRAMSGYTLKEEETNSLIYNGSGIIKGYIYNFENEKLCRASFGTTLLNSLNLSDFLMERYLVVDAEKKGDNEYYFYLASVDLKTYICYYVNSSGCIVLYIDVSDEDSSSQTELKANMKRYISNK